MNEPAYQDVNKEAGDDDLGLDTLLRYLESKIGLNFKQYKPNYLKRRIGVRMRATGCEDYLQYCHYIKQNHDESQKLINDLTINVTEFFRDSDVYEAIRKKIIPEIISYKKENRITSLRAWSAGCATGEEPYSLSILMLEALKKEKNSEQWVVRITATDLDDKAVQSAKIGRYAEAKVLPGIQLDEYFFQGKGEYLVREKVKRPVRFLIMDIMKKPPLRHLDLIICRNVLIYFEKGKQHRILEIFNRCLRKGGFLVLGKSEAILGPGESGLVPYLRKERIYRKEQSLADEAPRGHSKEKQEEGVEKNERER
jgi:chemotaxis protein methyltransferase CheR